MVVGKKSSRRKDFDWARGALSPAAPLSAVSRPISFQIRMVPYGWVALLVAFGPLNDSFASADDFSCPDSSAVDWFEIPFSEKEQFDLRRDQGSGTLRECWCPVGKELGEDPGSLSSACTTCEPGYFLELPDKETTRKAEDGSDIKTPYHFRASLWQHRDTCRKCDHCYSADGNTLSSVDPEKVCRPETGECICKGHKFSDGGICNVSNACTCSPLLPSATPPPFRFLCL